MTQEMQLLPCPFCGGEAERIDIEDGDNYGGSFVHCTVCDASGNIEFGFKENFISNWNRRTHAKPDTGSAVEAVWIGERDLEFLREGKYREAKVFNYEDDHRVTLHPASEAQGGWPTDKHVVTALNAFYTDDAKVWPDPVMADMRAALIAAAPSQKGSANE